MTNNSKQTIIYFKSPKISMINKLIIAIIAFLGLLAGQFLAKIAKEEVKPGLKYFKQLKRLILLALTFALLYPNIDQYASWIFPFIIGFILSFFLKKRYLILGFSLVLASTISPQFFLLVAILIFLYGLPYGTLNKNLLENFIIFAVPFILLFFPEILTDYSPIFLPLLAGTLFLKE